MQKQYFAALACVSLVACSSAPLVSRLKDNGIVNYDAAAALYMAGSVPSLADLNPTHFIIGSTIFDTATSTLVPLSGFFYLDPATQNTYYDGIFYAGEVPSWSLSDYIAKVTPLIRAGTLLPLTLSADGTAYSGGVGGLVNGSFRVATDAQDNRYLVQSRVCIADAGCNIPDSFGHRQHFAKDEQFGFSFFLLPAAPLPPLVAGT